MRRVLVLSAAAIAVVLLGSGAASAACVPRTTPDIGSPFVTRNVTRLDTQTSDAVKFTGGCIDGVDIGQNATAGAAAFASLTIGGPAVCDGFAATNGAITSGTAVFTSATAGFTAAAAI